MSGFLSLNGIWALTWAEGGQLSWPEEFSQAKPAPGRRLLAAEVPSPVHRVLEKNGLLEDPNYGMNSLKARWVEECFWIYRRRFSVPAEVCSGTAHLVFDRLEMIGRILLNGEEVGRCDNALYPVRIDVSGKLRPGENTLVIVLESGVFAYADHPGKIGELGETGWMTKRNWLRKAQHQSGWDWHPRLQNVGILGDVRLEYAPGALAGQISLTAVAAPDLGSARVRVAADAYRGEGQCERATLSLRIVETGEFVEKEVVLPVGRSRSEVEVTLNAPRLWWPAGCGESFRYTAEIEFLGKRTIRRFGVRKVEFDQSAHPEEGRYFILKINERRVFCKGGNLVPADLYYSEVDGARYRKLVEIAKEANFNLLRIWGGGIYMTEEFCDACDELGIMIWHDFIFACGKYPGEDVEFVANVRREAEFVVRELGSHPALVVWCGNNELETGNWNWYPGITRVGWTDHALFHHELAKIVHDESPQTFYWPSSPYSPDFRNPNDPHCGDQHPWTIALDSPGGTDFWNYRHRTDRFPNEGGVLGASTIPTLRQFLPENERCVKSFSWDHHDNPFARRDLEWGKLGHAYETVKLWTGRDPLKLSLEEYAVLSGLLQAEGLEEYIYNYRRRMYSSASAIFWMYNDSWPVTNGWTIIDYYLRRKLAFHPVRRAFAPIAVVIVAEGGCVTVYGVNDSDRAWRGRLRYGIFGVLGGLKLDCSAAAELAGNASTVLAQFPLSEWESRIAPAESGAFAILEEGGSSAREVASHRLFLNRFGELPFTKTPEIRMECGNGILTLCADCFVWKLCLDVDGETTMPDNAFDLFPGIPKRLEWNGNVAPVIRWSGNLFMEDGR